MDHVLHNIIHLLHGKSEKLRSNSFHQIKKKIKINEMIDIYAKDNLVAKNSTVLRTTTVQLILKLHSWEMTCLKTV